MCSELFGPALRDLMSKMNRKDMNERITLKQAMEHEYFEGVDWENLPTYETSIAQLTPLEVYLRGKCEELKSKFEGKFK